jgi:ketosteroid isomerase-like protein
MAPENVERVRAMLESIGPGSSIDQVMDEFLDPEIEWHDVPTYPSAGVYVGHDAFKRHAIDFEEAWVDWNVDVEDIRAAGPDQVVARIRYQAVGMQSGAEMTGGMANAATGAVFDLRDGRVLRVRQFVTHAEALEAVGLLE